jgi:hypothetical protein
MPSLWIDALKEFNRGKDMYCIPRKGTEPNAKVRRMMKGEPVSPDKKPAEKKEMGTSPKAESKKAEAPKAESVKAESVESIVKKHISMAKKEIKAKSATTPKKAATPKKADTPKKAATPKKADTPADALQNFMRNAEEDITGFNYGVPNVKGELRKGLIQQMVGPLPGIITEERKQNIKDMAESMSELGNLLYKLALSAKGQIDGVKQLEETLRETRKKEKFTRKLGYSLIDLFKRNRQNMYDQDDLVKVYSAIAKIGNSLNLSLKISKNIRIDLYREHVEPPYSAPGPTETIMDMYRLLPGNILSINGEGEYDDPEASDQEDMPYTYTIELETNILRDWKTVSYEKGNKLVTDKRKDKAADLGIPQGKKNAKTWPLAEFLEVYKKYNPAATEKSLSVFKGPSIKAYLARTRLHFENVK